MSLKVVVESATTSATTCGCIHWTYIFYSLEQVPGTGAHFSSEAELFEYLVVPTTAATGTLRPSLPYGGLPVAEGSGLKGQA